MQWLGLAVESWHGEGLPACRISLQPLTSVPHLTTQNLHIVIDKTGTTVIPAPWVCCRTTRKIHEGYLVESHPANPLASSQ